MSALLVVSGGDRASAAETVVELPIDGTMDLLLNETKGHIYVSSGSDNNSVLVLDLSGNVVETITNVAGAALMDLSPTGDILWVAAPDADEVIGYSTDTFDEVHRIEFASGGCPFSVADLGGTLAVGGTCGSQPIRIVDVATKSIVAAGGSTVSSGLVVHHQAWGDRVLAAKVGGSPFTVFEVNTAAATPEAVRVMFGPGSNLRDLAPHPDGASFVTASGSPYIHQEFAFGSYAALTQYDSTNYPNAAAWSGDGAVLAGGTSSSYDDDIHVFLNESSTSFWTWNLVGGLLQPRGLALDHDGSTVYALSGNYSSDVVRLHIVDVGTLLPGSIRGTIEHDFPTFNSGRADQGHVDLYVADTNEYLGTWDADGTGNYTIPSVEPGVYELVFWNGDDEYIIDFFPELYKEQPLFLDVNATPVTVGSGETVTINGHLRPLFFDMFDSVFIDDIYWMGNAGITRGCNPPDNTLYCPDDVVTRGAMAAFLTRAFWLPAGDGTIDFVDDNGSVFESDIEKLAYAGITRGCNPPVNDRFCPDEAVTRGQLAAFLKRGFAYVASLAQEDPTVFERSAIPLSD
jgi:sugar lactone lactonase YvrE